MAFQRSKIPGEDIRRGSLMVEKRRELIAGTPAEPIVYEFGVDRLAKALHPEAVKARITDRRMLNGTCAAITLTSLSQNGRFPYFRAGQFVTLSARISDSFISRPYSIVSSPREALEGKLEIIVQKKGIFSAWLIEEAGPDSEISISGPCGDFCHDDLRDSDTILAIAGGSGVTPFLSMMKAVREGSEDFRLILLYGVRDRGQVLFDPQEYADDRIKIDIVLSEEEAEGFRHGLIDRELLKGYLNEKVSIFMCGPDAMYDYVGKQLESLGIDPHGIRQERNSIGERKVDEIRTFTLKVHIRDEVREIEAKNSETLLTAMERAGIAAPSRCRNGTCGFCHSRLIAGRYLVDERNDYRRAADRVFGFIHPCCTYPLSDLEIDVPFYEV